MTLSASPSPLPIRPSSTAVLAIRNSGITGYCFQLATKYKSELKYAPKRGFISAGAKQLITVAALSSLTPGLRIQIYAVATEKSLGTPTDDMIKVIIDGAKQLKTPCVNLKIDVINLDAHAAEDQQTQLPPAYLQKGSSTATNVGVDSETSLFDNYVAHTQKNSYSLTNNTDTLYSNDQTYTSLVDSQLCEMPGKRTGQANSQLIDSLDVDMKQLKLQVQLLESKIDSILETVPLTTSSKLSASQSLELSEIDINNFVSVVTERLTAELKSQLAASAHNKTVPHTDSANQEMAASEMPIAGMQDPAVQEDEDNRSAKQEQSQRQSIGEPTTDADSTSCREQSSKETEVVKSESQISNSVSRQLISEAPRSSSSTSAGKQLQNALGNIFILSIIFAIAACGKLLKRALRSKKET